MKKTAKKLQEPIECSICHEPIPPGPGGWMLGNNAQPVNAGRCCDACNTIVVIPARLERIFGRQCCGD